MKRKAGGSALAPPFTFFETTLIYDSIPVQAPHRDADDKATIFFFWIENMAYHERMRR